ncbi:RHS repeat-associated core domain-containing protein [Oceanicoccus sagamiensis]|uniref:RHS protein conserved region domain-containing protein n=1 Tax=Oceanicoccus sagamiensis TaxID=716816 RepID=A0A1X9NG62_9GAMM|nr:RHS repeat-associated core domain-containing protein [Oceanicoccus sagamiensis]ARN73937.1 hypothetical protein BST96_07300 [Oceanicoccus sagamiensis]
MRRITACIKPVLWVIVTVFVATTARAEIGTYYIHNDHLGTPQVVTDENQTVVWQANKKPFGETEEVVSGIDQQARFLGQYFDEESGLAYNYYRDYDPTTGRYIQSDPVGLVDGSNTYTYVQNNPLIQVDPLGLWSVSVDGYFGIGGPGGGVSFGKNPNGTAFVSVRVGAGAGAGIGFDPDGTSPAYDSCKNEDSEYLGVYSKAEVGIGITVGAEANAGVGKEGGTYSKANTTDGISNKAKLSAQVGVGVERTYNFK